MKCSKCQFECDTADAFCRKCGTALAQEASFTELAQQPEQPVTVQAEVVEIVSVSAEVPQALVQQQSAARRTTQLAKQAGAKLSQALKTEQGKKLTQAATALAVAVGTEIATQAVARLTKTPVDTKMAKPSAVGVADSMLKAMEDGLNAPATEVEETYIRERVVYRRRIRKGQS